MAGLINNLFGGQKPIASPVPSTDDGDFADFAGAADPSPQAIISSITPAGVAGQAQALPTAGSGGAVVYTAWYRIWERSSPRDFIQEGVILSFLLVVVGVHLWGTKKNRGIAKKWINSIAPVLQDEFALVGFGGVPKAPSAHEVEGSGLANLMAQTQLAPEKVMKQDNGQTFVTYATGRQNVAYVDVMLSLYKRYNPLSWFGEVVISFFFDSVEVPVERMEATLSPFDGRETKLVPVTGGKAGQEVLEQRAKSSASAYDNFVWAVVNKDSMKKLRDDRYDISLTTTKDHPKLPNWATVMSESSEITDMMLAPELVKAVEEAGELLEFLIVTDQPLEKPKTLDEAAPQKKIDLSLRLPDSFSKPNPTLTLFSYFLRLPDQLAAKAHLRPEVLRKVKATREEQTRQLRKIDEEEKAEERRKQLDKEKKDLRDARLRSMNADEQKKFLEKEREKETRKSQKKMQRKA